MQGQISSRLLSAFELIAPRELSGAALAELLEAIL